MQILLNASPEILVGYMGMDLTKPAMSVACGQVTLPAPEMAILPTIIPATFAVTPIGEIFGVNQQQTPVVPSSVMGICGLHNGTVHPCIGTLGSTLDIVPRSVELCIDTRATPFYNECDQAHQQQIPVYAPVSGCVEKFRDKTIGINIDCDNVPPGLPGSRDINFAHILPVQGLSDHMPISAGQLIGYLCPNGNHDKVTKCNIDSDSTPTHLAVDFRYKIVSNGTTTFQDITDPNQAQIEVLGTLALPSCLYDDWVGANGAPTPYLNSPYAVCP